MCWLSSSVFVCILLPRPLRFPSSAAAALASLVARHCGTLHACSYLPLEAHQHIRYGLVPGSLFCLLRAVCVQPSPPPSSSACCLYGSRFLCLELWRAYTIVAAVCCAFTRACVTRFSYLRRVRGCVRCSVTPVCSARLASVAVQAPPIHNLFLSIPIVVSRAPAVQALFLHRLGRCWCEPWFGMICPLGVASIAALFLRQPPPCAGLVAGPVAAARVPRNAHILCAAP